MRGRKAIVFGLADIALIALGLWLAFLLRFDGTLPLEYQGRFLYYFLILAALNIAALSSNRLYSFSWEFVSLRELNKLFLSVTYANAVFAIIVFIARENTAFFAGFPRSVIFITYFLNLIFLGAIRIAKRVWHEIVKKGPVSDAPRALIVGAGPEGEQLIRVLLKSDKAQIFPIGIVDHRPEKQGVTLHGIRVLGTVLNLPKIVKDNNVEHVIIALASAEADVIKNATKTAREAGIKDIKIIPETHELLSGRVSLADVREIEIEDLLGRNPAKLETEKIAEFVKDKIVLVTGAAGSIGSEIARQVAGFQPKKLILLDFNESGVYDLHMELIRSYPVEMLQPVIANISDRSKIFSLVKNWKPDVIFHAAAYKHVPLMEEYPEEAVQT
ncbi:MAG: Polysaccharide biosynthesis protein CapD, partial [Candidatus Jorgensenbacteria bacterium GW2011_GWC1_48_8]